MARAVSVVGAWALTANPAGAGAVPAGAGAFADRPAEGAAPVDAAPAEACSSWAADYALAVRVRLEDTPHGAGDGTHHGGTGKLRLRFSGATGSSLPSRVEMLSYEVNDHFIVDSHVLFIHAKVTTDSVTRATPNSRGVVATGTVTPNYEVAWSTPVSGYRTDGTITCDGSGCGIPGVPPKGTSALHLGPSAPSFAKFRFDSPKFETFTMAYSRVSHSEMPQQTAFVSVSGRQTARQCLDKSPQE